MNHESLALEIGALVEAQLDGRATLAEQQRLEFLVTTDEQARALYLEYMGDTLMLGALAGAGLTPGEPVPPTGPNVAANSPTVLPPPGAAAESSPAAPPPTTSGEGTAGAARSALLSYLWPSERWLDALPVVMFAGVMLALGVFFGGRLFAPQQPLAGPKDAKQAPSPSREVASPAPAVPGERVQVATLVEEADCAWVEAPMDFRPGSLVFEGQRLELASGTALVVLRSGTRLVMEGPATLTMSQPNRLQLGAGSVGVRVPPEAVGFSIDTPIATVVDLGTEFSVSVDREQMVEVHVFVGQVAVSGRAASGSVRSERLAAGDALRLPSGDRMTWSRIALAPERQFDTARARAASGAAQPQVPAAAAPMPMPAGPWRTVLEQRFDAAGIGDRWRQILVPVPPSLAEQVTVAPQLRSTPQGLELVNGAGILSTEPIALASGDECRVQAEVTFGHEAQNVYLLSRARLADQQRAAFDVENGIAPRFTHGIACMLGAFTPDGRRNMAILITHPGQGEPTLVHWPCEAPQAGQRYVLTAIDDGRSVRFRAELAAENGWQKEVQLDIPSALQSEPARVGAGNLGAWPGEAVVAVLEKFMVEVRRKEKSPAPEGGR